MDSEYAVRGVVKETLTLFKTISMNIYARNEVQQHPHDACCRPLLLQHVLPASIQRPREQLSTDSEARYPTRDIKTSRLTARGRARRRRRLEHDRRRQREQGAPVRGRRAQASRFGRLIARMDGNSPRRRRRARVERFGRGRSCRGRSRVVAVAVLRRLAKDGAQQLGVVAVEGGMMKFPRWACRIEGGRRR